MTARFRVGTSGWIYPHWRGVFYPERLRQAAWFEHYAQHFDTVEINYSFYRLPSPEAFDRWREQSPEAFLFAVKANRFLTHVRRLKGIEEPLDRFLGNARRLGPKLGPILWQLPPNWRPDLPRLEAFAALLPRDLVHAFEFRDPRWFIEPVRSVLEQHGLSLCVFDMPEHPCPVWATSPVVYMRFHGVAMVYGGQYGRNRLRAWARRIAGWLEEGRSVYAYFNNDALGYAVEDAKVLRELVEG